MSTIGRELEQFTKFLSHVADGARIGNELKNRHWGGIISGKITSVEDPENKGRVQVSLDYNGNKFTTPEWVPVLGSHGGRQPQSLIGTKVLIAAIDGSLYEYMVLDILDGHPGTNDVTSDGEYDTNFDLLVNKSEIKDKFPLSSVSGFMKRLPVYSAIVDERYLPTCNGISVGAQIMYDDGSNTKVLTCQRVKGIFVWTFAPQQMFSP